MHAAGGVWFFGWGELVRIVITGLVVFAALLASIRLAGNRALSSMNASDFIVTVAVGTTFATTMLSSEVSVAGGVTAIVLLIGIQALLVWMSVKYPALRHRAEGQPIVLLREGRPCWRELEQAHVGEEELRQAVRQQGYGGFEQLHLVLLEANGRFSVVPREQSGDRAALQDERSDHLSDRAG